MVEMGTPISGNLHRYWYNPTRCDSISSTTRCALRGSIPRCVASMPFTTGLCLSSRCRSSADQNQSSREDETWTAWNSEYLGILSGWWFQTLFFPFHIWDHPSHWLSYFSIWLSHHQPDFIVLLYLTLFSHRLSYSSKTNYHDISWSWPNFIFHSSIYSSATTCQSRLSRLDLDLI